MRISRLFNKSTLAMALSTVMAITSIVGEITVSGAEENLCGSYTVDLANGKNGYASSNQRQSKNYPIKVNNLTNGSTTGSNYIITSSEDEAPWFCVDLGSSYDINKVTACQGADASTYANAYATDYVIEYSSYTGDLGGSTTDENAAYIENNMTWTTAATVSGGTLGNNTSVFESVNTRYIRLRATSKVSDWVSLYELYVYQTDFTKAYNPNEEDDNMKILFIGNSLTYYNDVATKVKNIFAHEGVSVECDTLIQLGKTLEYHYSLEETGTTILNGDYDYIILQDKASSFDGDLLMTGVTHIYDSYISKTNAQLVMYMPWANKSVLKTTQEYFTNSYLAVARKYNCPIALAGEAWFDLFYNYGYDFYSDDIHGTNVGSFISANAIYYAISGASTAINYKSTDSIITSNSYDINVANLISDKAFWYTYQGNQNLSTYTSIAADFVESETTAQTPTEETTTLCEEGEYVTGTVVDKSIFLDSSNIALGKTVYASTSVQAATNAVDGNDGTRWESEYNDPQWIYVDLGKSYNIDRVGFDWEGAYAKKYHIQVSDVGGTDNSAWTTIKTVTATGAGAVQISLGGVSARYVRMLGEDRGTIYGYSIYELGVWTEESASYGQDGQVKDTEILDIEGFQLKTSYDEKGNADPGYRIIERLGSDSVDGKQITSHGIILMPQTSYNKSLMTVDEGDIAGTDLNSSKLNENGVCVVVSSAGSFDWTSSEHQDESNSSYYSYMMVNNISDNVTDSLKCKYCVRAFAKLSNGDIIYSPVYSESIYDAADSLYQGRKMNSESAHNYLYDNILSVVTSDYGKVEYAWSNSLHKPTAE